MWRQEQALACPGCNQPRDEVWATSAEDQREKEARWTGKVRRCVVCAQHAFTSKQYQSRPDPIGGAHVTVVPAEVA
jgi:hypothetical protein